MELPKVLLSFKAIIINKLRILIIKRAHTDRLDPDMWEFPGGKMEVGEAVENILGDNVFREVGLEVSLLSKLGYIQSEVARHFEYKGLPIVRTYVITKSLSDKVRLSQEHSEYKWVTLREAYEYDLSPSARKALQNLEDSIKEYLWKQ